MDVLCSSEFVNEFMEVNDFLAKEMQLRISHYLNMDFENQSRLTDALNQAQDFGNINDANERKKVLRQLMNILHGVQDLNDERKRIVSDMQNLIDDKRLYLDAYRKRISAGDSYSNKDLEHGSKTNDLKSNDSDSRVRMSTKKRQCTARFKTDRSSRLQNTNKSQFSLKSRQQEGKTPNRQGKSIQSKRAMHSSSTGKKTKLNSSNLKSRRKENPPKESDQEVGRKAGTSSNRGDNPRNSNDPLYCTCNQVSFGEMIACDNENCPIEWFHFACVNVYSRPKGKWYCPKCRLGDSAKSKRPEA